MEPTQDRPDEHSLSCMEIWSGCQAADTAVSTPGLDFWVYSCPHESAAGGGDVHYVSLCGGGMITRFILADVSGHGASAAEVGRSLRDLMRRNINRKSQDRLVTELNRQFGEMAKLNRFATALVGTYLTKGDKLTICNAGHPHPVWFRASTGEWSFLNQETVDTDSPLTNLPLGIDETTDYQQQIIALGRGDILLFYTDAVTEATDARGRMLGEAGLIEMVRTLDAGNPATMPKSLLDQLDQFRGSRPFDDDLTLLLLHHNAGRSPHLTLWQQVVVAAKVFGLKKI